MNMISIRQLLKQIGLLTILPVMMAANFSSNAGIITISAQFSGNDCSGYFGQGFDSCQIFQEFGSSIQISPVISKYDVDSDSWEVNDAVFSAVSSTGDEWSLNTAVDGLTGTWDYLRGTDDPGIRYWAAKAGGGKDGGFILYWNVDDTMIGNGSACDTSLASYYTLDCLYLAEVTESGSWATGALSASLSHLTFYDSVEPIVCSDPSDCGGGGTGTAIPEPSIAFLFLAGLAGLGLSQRRRKIKH